MCLACAAFAACQAGKVVEIKDTNEFITWALSAFSSAEPVTDTVMLLNDLTFDPVTSNVVPLGETHNTMFSGILDGNGHTIHNLVVDRSGKNVNVGLFTKLQDATIKNITMASTCIFTAEDEMSVGAFAAVTEGTVIFDHVLSEATVRGMHGAGGFIGEVQSGVVNITNCKSNGRAQVANKITDNSGFGGFIAIIYKGNVTFNSCVFTGLINQTAEEDYPPLPSGVSAVYEQMAAGFVGSLMHSSNKTLSFVDCVSAGSLLSIDETNGFASTSVDSMENCLFSGYLQHTGYNAIFATKVQKAINMVVTGTIQSVFGCTLFRVVDGGVYENVFILDSSYHRDERGYGDCFNATNMTWDETKGAYFVNDTQESVDEILNAKVNQAGYGFTWTKELKMVEKAPGPSSSSSLPSESPCVRAVLPLVTFVAFYFASHWF